MNPQDPVFQALAIGAQFPTARALSSRYPFYQASTMTRISHHRPLVALLSLFPCSFVSLLLLPSPSWPAPQDPPQPIIRLVRNPDPAPDFKLAALNGKTVTLAGLHGKVVFLNFWATWCGPCRAEVPDLVELQSRYKDKLQIIGMDVDDDDPAEVQQFADEYKVNYPVVMIPDDVRLQYGGIPALPTSFVLDTEGRVVQKHVGLLDPALYETEIRALLGMPILAKVETFEDTGEVFLKHADRATDLPGVDLSKLTPEQKKAALHEFNAQACKCGCKYTLAQCRIFDPACATSQKATAKIIADLLASHTPAAPGQTQSSPASSGPSTTARTPTPTTTPVPKPQPN